jgi:5-(carboxyamino)imidazole ribonucleotide mutase
MTKPGAAMQVSIIMGSKTDWEKLEPAQQILKEFEIPHEVKILSAHRAPDLLFQYISSAENQGVEIFIAGAGGAAHLPGMIAAKTLLPVIGVPVDSTALNGLDALLSIVQMPKGTPVATMAVGKAGAANAALFAVRMLAQKNPKLRERLAVWRENAKQEMLKQTIG